MVGEGSERPRRRPEGYDEDEKPEVDEKPRTAQDVMDEIRGEIENKEAEPDSEPKENPEETEPPREDPEPCVRDAAKELAWKEDMEREREAEKEREREQARQEREENAEKDALDDLEKELQKALEDRGVDPEDLKDRWRDQYVKDIEDYLKEQPEEKEQDSDEKVEEDDEGETRQKPGVESSSQHDAGGGQMYEMQTKPSIESETESEMEPQNEPAEDTQEPEITPETEPQKEKVQPSSGKSESSSETNTIPSEHEKPRAKEDAEEPDVESTPVQDTPTRTRSVEETGIEEKARSRTEQTPMVVPEETSKAEKEIESDESNTDSETETSEPEVGIETSATKEEAETQTSESEVETGETKEEAETESQEPEQVDESEDLAWQEWLIQKFNELPEEWREMFQEYLRGLVEDEEDLKRLLKKHGLEYLLEDEEQMEEVRKFLALKAALQEQGEENLESIAAKLGIDMDQAEQWAKGENEPQILVDVLNLEGLWAFWEMLRLNAERHDFPESVEELEEILQDNPMLELEDPMQPFELWKKDAKAWVEIMGMKKRGEIPTQLRNGREIYHREVIERLSAKYSLPKTEIIGWLRGEKVPPLIRKVRPILRKKNADIAYHHLMNAYREMYFYFKTQKDFNDYIRQLGDSLGISNKRDIINHIKRIAPQITSGTGPYFQTRYMRIKGGLLFGLNRSMGKTLSDLSGKISKLTKRSGKGGIQNPKFPSGLKLEIAIARLVAVAVSDCHLKPNGTLEYFEPRLSRIRLVEKNLQVFGDIKLNPKFVKRDNVYVSYFPTPLGKVLQHWGWPSGDKTVQNSGLFSWIFQLSLKALAAFIEDLVPQDGSVSSNRVSWTHSNALHPAAKGKKFHVTAKVGGQEIEMIRKFGKREKHCWVITPGRIKELREHNNKTIARTAIKFRDTIYANPNKLIMDEEKIAQLLGIKVDTKPQTIRYHIRSGRVSVAWYTITENLYETIKLAIVAPPNDKVKRNHLRVLLLKYPNKVKRAVQEMTNRGVEIDEWWK